MNPQLKFVSNAFLLNFWMVIFLFAIIIAPIKLMVQVFRSGLDSFWAVWRLFERIKAWRGGRTIYWEAAGGRWRQLVFSTLCSVHCAVCTVQCAVCSVQCAIHTVQSAMHIVQCAIHTEKWPAQWRTCRSYVMMVTFCHVFNFQWISSQLGRLSYAAYWRHSFYWEHILNSVYFYNSDSLILETVELGAYYRAWEGRALSGWDWMRRSKSLRQNKHLYMSVPFKASTFLYSLGARFIEQFW